MKSLIKFFVALNANSRPSEIGLAFGLAFLLALVPKGLLWFIFFLLAILIKIHLPSLLLMSFLFNPLGILFSDFLHVLGQKLMEIPLIAQVVQGVMLLPLGSLLNINNTVVLGGAVAGIVLLIPMTILFTVFVNLYRKVVRDKIAESKLVKAIGKLPLISTVTKAYQKASRLYS